MLSNSLLELAEMNGLKLNKVTEKWVQSKINMLTMENDNGEFDEFSVYRLLGKLKNQNARWPKPNETNEEKLAQMISQLLGAFNSSNEHWKFRNFWEELDQKSRKLGRERLASQFPKERRRIMKLNSGRNLAEILYEMYKKVKKLRTEEEKKLKGFEATAAESSDSKGKQKNI
jgi:hypothetical protein